MQRSFLFAVGVLLGVFAMAQSPETMLIRGYREKKEHQWLKEFQQFLSIPNLAPDTTNIKQNATRIQTMMRERGIANIQLLFPTTPNIPPAVYGEVMVPGAKKTLIFYAHYDGQPVDTSKWFKGLKPFKPSLLNASLEQNGEMIPWPNDAEQINPNWRIYARGASDDKAGVMAILSAYEALKATGAKLNYNLKFFFEGEEEAGSDHLFEILEKNKNLLASDAWIICDGPVHQSGKKMVYFGVRGDAHAEITVYGSKRPLHSGHYGNWAPNPANLLVHLLASMKDENGKVLIKGFYDDVTPLSARERKALDEIPVPDAQMKNELGFILQENAALNLSESILLPSLNINGMQSANIGKLSSNIIPTTATASLDLRLVLGNDFKKQQQKLVAHVKAQGYYVTDKDPTDAERKEYAKIAKISLSDGYNAQRTSMDLPIAQDVINAVKSTTTEQVVLLPSAGGSLPLFVFEKYLKANTISVPIANHDNNQHAENENIRLRNLWNGIETFAAIMLMK
jgi:acetylornithine deacetylase/succinyl-diaminopimelate desuccinylase-like protein